MQAPPRRILITGAAGFVGRHLTGVLASAFPEATQFTGQFDIANEAAVDNAVHTAKPDACVHLAAISTNAAAMPDEARAWAVNLHGTLHLAHAIQRHLPDCQLLFASTADAYGASFRSGSKLAETVPLAPLSLYAATKAAADLALGAMAEQGLRVVRLRPANHTGPGQSSALVVASFARQVARIEAGLQPPVIDVGNLDPMRDFLDVRDVCDAYAACMSHRDTMPPGAILNIASGEPRRIGDILQALLNAAGVTAEIRVDPGRTRTTDVKLACCDPSLARDLIGWAVRIPWQQTLRDVLHDWRQHIAAEPDSS